jgi:hypothetical protein
MPNTLFTKVDYALGSLIDAIGNGQIGLPDIQRPFVWKNVSRSTPLAYRGSLFRNSHQTGPRR